MHYVINFQLIDSINLLTENMIHSKSLSYFLGRQRVPDIQQFIKSLTQIHHVLTGQQKHRNSKIHSTFTSILTATIKSTILFFNMAQVLRPSQ